jgi:hypothetical protein
MRTTIDIDEPILSAVKSAGKRRGKPLGRMVSDLLAVALAEERRATGPVHQPFRWTAKHMGARVDLADQDAVYDAMDGGRS